MYGNFFYQNPVEALLQVTGNIALYNNVFVNHHDASGFRAVYVTAQNGFQPRDMHIFHNTVWTANSSGGIRLYNPDPAYRQYCYGNAVFSPAPITNFIDTLANVTDGYMNAGDHVLSATADLSTLDLYPSSDRLKGEPVPVTQFASFTDAQLDFNRATYDWSFRGAYAGCCGNPGWKLQLDTIVHTGNMTSVTAPRNAAAEAPAIFPNPAHGRVLLSVRRDSGLRHLRVFDLLGREMFRRDLLPGDKDRVEIEVASWTSGIYLLLMEGSSIVAGRFVVRHE